MHCPRCRLQHLFAFWIFGHFRKTKSALNGKTLITTFSETVPFPLYDREEWISDAWDPMEYGQSYDDTRSFFEQFKELQAKVPHPHQSGVNNVNCQWSDDVWDSRECYLCRSLIECEFISYGYRTLRCKNSIDLTYCFDTELSYDCLYCFKCYKVQHAINSRDCIDSAFLYDCRNVQNCFMCWNLRNKQYHILNQPYSKEEYFKKLKEFDLHSYGAREKLKKEFQEIIATRAVHRESFTTNAVRSTGNFLADCKNCSTCAFLERSENCRYVWRGHETKDSIDAVGTAYNEKIGCSTTVLGSYEGVGLLNVTRCRYSFYLENCEECEYCFGCVGLRKKKFCIFNKQYSEEEYNVLLKKIKQNMEMKKEWGKFFPMSFAHSGYNLSLANILFPETRENIEKRGGLWNEETESSQEGISGNDLPDRIDDADDAIPGKAIVCPMTKRRFSIAPHELKFYREQGIPLPHLHPDERTITRFKLLAQSIIPVAGTCHFCNKQITHYYPPELGYSNIACIECYQREVI